MNRRRRLIRRGATNSGDALRALAVENRTLVMTSHDDEFVRAFATRVVVLADGSVVEEGDPSAVLLQPQHEATKALLQVGYTPGPVPARPSVSRR